MYEISPLPKAKSSGGRKRKAQRSEVLTSSPFQKSLAGKVAKSVQKTKSAKVKIGKENRSVKTTAVYDNTESYSCIYCNDVYTDPQRRTELCVVYVRGGVTKNAQRMKVVHLNTSHR